MITQELINEHNTACEISKKDAPKGEWTTEPNRIEFTHAGYSCLLSRNFSLLNWCGYVGISKSHPYYQMDELDLNVHGGVTYSSLCSEIICHFSDNESEPLFWLGFDCAHCDDLVPKMLQFMDYPKHALLFGRSSNYKNVDYVMHEVKYLAEQLREIENRKSH